MIDLHTHTDESDGTLTPVELVEAAVQLGLEALCLQPHPLHDLRKPRVGAKLVEARIALYQERHQSGIALAGCLVEVLGAILILVFMSRCSVSTSGTVPSAVLHT
jgi:hypothetical protein